MIPKVIHWCWFGRGQKSELILRCVQSWKKYCPDYKIIEWNEDNFDIECNQYVKEAYFAKKYAFVADYVRLKVLYEQGGIYLDSDVEIVKEFSSSFLEHRGFSGFQSPEAVPTGIIASEQGFELLKFLLDYYENKTFINLDGTLNDTTNVAIITEELVKRGLVLNNTYQEINGFALYPRDFFCPLEDWSGKMYSSDNTYTIHWFSKTWWNEADVHKYKRAKIFYRIFGENFVISVSQIKGKIMKHLKR